MQQRPKDIALPLMHCGKIFVMDVTVMSPFEDSTFLEASKEFGFSAICTEEKKITATETKGQKTDLDLQPVAFATNNGVSSSALRFLWSLLSRCAAVSFKPQAHADMQICQWSSFMLQCILANMMINKAFADAFFTINTSLFLFSRFRIHCQASVSMVQWSLKTIWSLQWTPPCFKSQIGFWWRACSKRWANFGWFCPQSRKVQQHFSSQTFTSTQSEIPYFSTDNGIGTFLKPLTTEKMKGLRRKTINQEGKTPLSDTEKHILQNKQQVFSF